GLGEAEWSGAIPAEWFATRQLTSFSLDRSAWRAIDLRSARTISELRTQLGSRFAEIGYLDFDFSHALNKDVRLTQEIASRAFDNAFSGIIYSSRFALDRTCVAIFEGSTLVDMQASTIEHDDPDLIWAANILRLRIPRK